MAIGSGLAGSFGIAPETVYGTYAAPTRHLEVQSAKLKKVKNVQQSKGLAAGRAVPLASRRVVTSHAATGSFPLEVTNKGMGVLFNMLCGGTVAPVQQATSLAYLQSHAIGSSTDTAGKMFSAQTGIADTSGTVRPYSFLGCKITKAEFSCGVDEYLTMAVDVDAREVVESQPLAAPSYAAGLRPFHWGQGAIKIGDTTATAAAVDGVRKVTCAVERKMDTGRFYYGGGGRKAEPILNDFTGLSGSIDADFVVKADFADRYAADTPFALVWEFTGPIIAATFNETFRITAPVCFLDDETPTLDGPDLAKMPLKYTILNDGTNPPFLLEYMSADVAL